MEEKKPLSTVEKFKLEEMKENIDFIKVENVKQDILTGKGAKHLAKFFDFNISIDDDIHTEDGLTEILSYCFISKKDISLYNLTSVFLYSEKDNSFTKEQAMYKAHERALVSAIIDFLKISNLFTQKEFVESNKNLYKKS